MEKKRSVGVIIAGIILILFSLFCLIPALVFYSGNWPRLLSYILWLISGIGLLFFKEWARILSLFPMGYLLLMDIIFFKALIIRKALLMELPLIATIVFFIIYLTRPKVKEQFK